MIDLAFDLGRPRQDELGLAQQSARKNSFDSSKFVWANPWLTHGRFLIQLARPPCLRMTCLLLSILDGGGAVAMMMMMMICSHGVVAVDLDLMPFLQFCRQAFRCDVYTFSDVLHSLKLTTTVCFTMLDVDRQRHVLFDISQRHVEITVTRLQ